MLKRLFDILFSFSALLLFSPFFILISALVLFSGKGGIFFFQTRVGKGNKDFKIFKFRTMVPDSEKSGQITVGAKDTRITKVGYYLRKLKLDEVPQLINVLIGEMSVVGPRPEVRKYVSMYNADQLRVLEVKPGITDWASLKYFSENEVLGTSSDPEKTYTEVILPEKLRLNLEYINQRSFVMDLKIIAKTIAKIFGV
jgi:lipopolysaccharide/colanic/teichoic acid biosynthesis glycosyltransferase